MKIIRWWGILVFPLFIGFIVLMYWLFAERLLKHGIEEAGTVLVGAKVELDDLDLDWQQGKLQLTRLQVTNKNAPMRNLVEIKTIIADIDMAQVLWLRTHIDNVAVQGMQFDTARKTSGAVADVESSAALDLLPELTQFDWNSLADQGGWQKLFDNLQLDSLQAVDDLRGDLKKAEADVKARIDALPSNDVLKAYEDRLKKLTGKLEGDKLTRALQLVERGKELDKLRKELKAELEKVKDVERQYKDSKKQLQAQYERVKQAPEKDIDKVLSQLTVELPGTDQLISRVLGPELNQRLQQGNSLYQSASPWIEKARVLAGQNPDAPPPPARFAGVDVHFPLHDPQPDFWLKVAALDGEFTALGNQIRFAGQLRDISDDPNAIAQPMTLHLNGEAVKGGKAELHATIDRRRASPGQRVQFALQDLPLVAIPVSADKQLTMTVTQAALSAQLNGEFTAARSILDGTFNFTAMQMDIQTASDHKFLRAVIDELKKTSEFDLRFHWLKTIDAEEKKLSSSLDDIAKKAVKNVLRQELDSKKVEVKAKLRERAQAELAKLDVDWGSLSALEPLLGDKLKSLTDMIDKAKKT